MEHIQSVCYLDLAGVLGAEFAVVDPNAIPLCILYRSFEFAILFAFEYREWIGDRLRKFWSIGQRAGITYVEDEQDRSLGLKNCDRPCAGMNPPLVVL
jgi:hypothetical protein